MRLVKSKLKNENIIHTKVFERKTGKDRASYSYSYIATLLCLQDTGPTHCPREVPTHLGATLTPPGPRRTRLTSERRRGCRSQSTVSELRRDLGGTRLDLDRARDRALLLLLLGDADVEHAVLVAGLDGVGVDHVLRQRHHLLHLVVEGAPVVASAPRLALDAERAAVESHLDVLRLDTRGRDGHLMKVGVGQGFRRSSFDGCPGASRRPCGVVGRGGVGSLSAQATKTADAAHVCRQHWGQPELCVHLLCARKDTWNPVSVSWRFGSAMPVSARVSHIGSDSIMRGSKSCWGCWKRESIALWT